jgi:hypothetical protein
MNMPNPRQNLFIRETPRETLEYFLLHLCRRLADPAQKQNKKRNLALFGLTIGETKKRCNENNGP